MFITRINKMFHKHGRIAFGLLTIVIIIPFVLYFSATPDDILAMFSIGGKSSNVSMNGNNISQKKLDEYTTNAMVAMTLQGYKVNFETMSDQPQILKEALNRVRLLDIANKRSIKVNDVQVASYIKSLPVFQVKGTFDISMYNMFVQYFLGRYRLGEEHIMTVARQNLVIDVLQKQISNSVVVTEQAAREFFNSSHESYNIKVASFNSSDYLDTVQESKEEVAKYFNANRSNYLIPAKYKAYVVRFNFIDFNKEAKLKVSNELIDNYYLQNKKEYNDIAENDAKVKIKTLLIGKESNRLAKNKAQTFAVNAYKLVEQADSEKNASAFEKIALKNGFKIHNIEDWIDADTILLPRLGKLPDLVKAITQLHSDQPITNAVLDKNAYFVACLTANDVAKNAEYSEVKDKVVKDFTNQKALELARSSAKSSFAKVTALLKNKKGLPTTDMNFKDFPVFTQSNPRSIIKEENGYNVFQEAVQTKEGSISKVSDTQNGAIIVYVDKIKLPSNKEFEEKKAGNIANFKVAVQQIAWSNFLLMLEQESNTLVKTPVEKKNS